MSTYLLILFPFIVPFYFFTTTMDLDYGIARPLPTMPEENIKTFNNLDIDEQKTIKKFYPMKVSQAEKKAN